MKRLIEGEILHGIILETFEPKSISRIRVRPIPNNLRDYVVEFPKGLRLKYPVGTRFEADVIVCQKHFSDGTKKGVQYLRAKVDSIKIVH